MNDEKRHKNREIGIYKSLIIAAGIMAVAILVGVAASHGFPVLYLAFGLIMPAGIALVVILIMSVGGLFRCSRLGRHAFFCGMRVCLCL